MPIVGEEVGFVKGEGVEGEGWEVAERDLWEMGDSWEMGDVLEVWEVGGEKWAELGAELEWENGEMGGCEGVKTAPVPLGIYCEKSPRQTSWGRKTR